MIVSFNPNVAKKNNSSQMVKNNPVAFKQAHINSEHIKQLATCTNSNWVSKLKRTLYFAIKGKPQDKFDTVKVIETERRTHVEGSRMRDILDDFLNTVQAIPV